MEVDIKNVITPQEKHLRTIFSVPRPYFIDIYQREYKWDKENVETLLNDIELRFLDTTQQETEPQKIQKDVQLRFQPYFLNTFLTHGTTSETSIVDGQQRLTTFLLILTKMYKVIVGIQSNPEWAQQTYSPKILKSLILEEDDFGNAARFKIHNPNRELAFSAVLEDKVGFVAKDETQFRILENYKIISSYFDNFFAAKAGDSCPLDLARLTYFISYLLDRLTFVEIRIERQNDVAMVFEVVNDRGKPLRPYEILKGKLIGKLSGNEKETSARIWTTLQDAYYKVNAETLGEGGLDLDDFFRTFFRAKFADNESENSRFEGKYHFEAYRNKKLKAYFGNFSDTSILYARVANDLKYFAELYKDLRNTYAYEDLIFNKLLDQKQQYMLTLSAIKLDDPQKEEKILLINKKFNQAIVLLRLLEVNDSISFVYELNAKLREQDLATISLVFDRVIIKYLEKIELVEQGLYLTLNALFDPNRFIGARTRQVNFTKYLLMRVDRYLAKLIDKPSYASENLKELEDRFNKNNRKRHGMHLEHILAHNDANKLLFHDANGAFDENRFNQERNRYGALVLLKEKQNLKSGNDLYKKKKITYTKSNFIWNEILVGHIDEIDLRKIPAEVLPPIVEPDEKGRFPLESIEPVQRAFFSVVQKIWGENV